MVTTQKSLTKVKASGASDKARDIRKAMDRFADREKESGRIFKDVGVGRTEQPQILLPEGMHPLEGADWLRQFAEDEETDVAIRIEFDAFPQDGAHALALTLKDIFGWTKLIPTPGTFFRPEQKPMQLDVEVGYNETVQIPWGRIVLPNIRGYIETRYESEGLRPRFVIGGQVQRQFESLISGIGDEVRAQLRENSIYRGKAIRLSLRDENGRRVDMEERQVAPRFLDMDRVQAGDLILPETTREMVEDCLWTPVQKTMDCVKNGVPIKRGVMLEGDYGTGKTMVAWVTAKLCEENGWTFLYIEDVRDLDIALEIARMYEPTVVFAEDVNRVVGSSRNEEVDRMLNTLDGVAAKDSQIITVLTTNEVNVIHQAMIRPGRVDTIIPVTAPDAQAAARLIFGYGRGLIDATEEQVADAMQPLVERQATAAVFREVVERAKLSAINRGQVDSHGKVKLSAEALAVAARSMSTHLGMLDRKPEDDLPNPLQVFGRAVGENISLQVHVPRTHGNGEFSEGDAAMLATSS